MRLFHYHVVNSILCLGYTITLFIAVYCENLYETQELHQKDLDDLVKRYQEKIDSEKKKICIRETQENVDLATLRREKSEAESSNGFLEDLARSMAESWDSDDEISIEDSRRTSSVFPPPNPCKALKFRDRNINIGEKFDIVKIVKVVEERKNGTKTIRPCKPPPKMPLPIHSSLLELPPNEPVNIPMNSPINSGNIAPSSTTTEAPMYTSYMVTMSPTFSTTTPISLAIATSTTNRVSNQTFQQELTTVGIQKEKNILTQIPTVNTQIPQHSVQHQVQSTPEKEEDLKSLFETFVPLLSGKNETDLKQFEENLLKEINNKTEIYEIGEEVDSKKNPNGGGNPGLIQRYQNYTKPRSATVKPMIRSHFERENMKNRTLLMREKLSGRSEGANKRKELGRGFSIRPEEIIRENSSRTGVDGFGVTSGIEKLVGEKLMQDSAGMDGIGEGLTAHLSKFDSDVNTFEGTSMDRDGRLKANEKTGFLSFLENLWKKHVVSGIEEKESPISLLRKDFESKNCKNREFIGVEMNDGAEIIKGTERKQIENQNIKHRSNVQTESTEARDFSLSSPL